MMVIYLSASYGCSFGGKPVPITCQSKPSRGFGGQSGGQDQEVGSPSCNSQHIVPVNHSFIVTLWCVEQTLQTLVSALWITSASQNGSMNPGDNLVSDQFLRWLIR